MPPKTRELVTALRAPRFEDRGARVAAESATESAVDADHAIYRTLGEGVKKVVHDSRKMASEPEKVVRAIHHAVTAENPKTRYSVGLDCKSQLFIDGITSDKMMDTILRKIMTP